MQDNPQKQTGDTGVPSVQARTAQGATARVPTAQVATTLVPSGQASQAQVATTQLPTARLVDASTACVNDAGGAEPNGLRLAITLFFGGLLRPRRAARRTSQIPLSTAFAIHAGFVFLIVAVVVATRTWDARFWFTETTRSDVQALFLLRCGVFDSNTFMDFLQGHLIPWFLNACVLELSVVALAFALSSWGAREEPLRVTLVNALRQTWLHTTSVFYVVLAIAALVVGINWWFRSDFRELGEAIPRALTNGIKFLEELYWFLRAWDHSTDDVIVPWFETHNTTLGLTAIALALGWLFATLLARIGARPVQKTSGRPPRCESCGYILYGIEVNGRCPECGAGVRNVIGPDARPGVPWQSSNGLVHIAAWFSTALYQLIRPASFGKRMQRVPGNFRHRTYAWISILLLAVCACVGVLYYNQTVYVFDLKHEYSRLDAWSLSSLQLAFLCLLSLIPASIAAVIALTACASIVGGWHRLRHGEGATAAAMQAASYASWLLPFACIMPFVIAAGIVTNSPLLARIAEFCSVAAIDHGVAFVTTPVVVILLLMTFIVARTTKAMRYASR